MFPTSDFNFVVAGLATFAATVGYACSRRLSASYNSYRANPESNNLASVASSSTTESDMLVDHDNEAVKDATPPTPHDSTLLSESSTHSYLHAAAPPIRLESLKRKAPHDGFDEPKTEQLGYPHNLANIYPPNKRSKTPSSDSTCESTQSEAFSILPSVSATTLDIIRNSVSALEDTDVSMTVAEPLVHIAVSKIATSSIDISMPVTEPPVSPSPPPDADAEVEKVSSKVPSPVPSAPPVVDAPLSAPTNVVDEQKISNTPIIQTASACEPTSVECISTPAPMTPKPLAHPGFGAFANRDAFSLSRPTTPGTPKPTTTSVSNPFAAFAGTASPFSAAAVRGKSVFGSSFGSGFGIGANANSNVSVFAAPSPLFTKTPGASGSGSNKDIFSSTPSVSHAWGNIISTNATESALADAPAFTFDKKSEDEGAAEKTAEEQEEAAKELEREQEEMRLAAEVREREEAEVREQEKREKRERRERKRKEREVGHAIIEATATASLLKDKNTPVTGEEEEDVELEQKGVRLFIKRGDKPFSEAIPGHIKVLAHRTTLEERVLFRREPLWKVSMNVRLQPTVRVTFVPEDHALRIILKETISDDDAESSSNATAPAAPRQEVAIYVIKPGRSCSKQDFKEFAETLLLSSQLKADGSKKARLSQSTVLRRLRRPVA